MPLWSKEVLRYWVTFTSGSDRFDLKDFWKDVIASASFFLDLHS